MDPRAAAIVEECKRQQESCLYTSATLYEYVKALRWWRFWFIAVPLVLATIGTLVKKDTDGWPLVLAGVCTMLAGLVPALYKGLDFDVNLAGVTQHAHQFKTLQDRFRQAANMTALGPFEEFKQAFDDLMAKMDANRQTAPTAPERYFKIAQAKIGAGHYRFDVDSGNSAPAPATTTPEEPLDTSRGIDRR